MLDRVGDPGLRTRNGGWGTTTNPPFRPYGGAKRAVSRQNSTGVIFRTRRFRPSTPLTAVATTTSTLGDTIPATTSQRTAEMAQEHALEQFFVQNPSNRSCPQLRRVVDPRSRVVSGRGGAGCGRRAVRGSQLGRDVRAVLPRLRSCSSVASLHYGVIYRASMRRSTAAPAETRTAGSLSKSRRLRVDSVRRRNNL